MTIRALLAALVLSAGCVSASECTDRVPEAIRADVLRFVVDRELVDTKLMTREDFALAMGAGRPYGSLSEAERNELSRWAAGYASCLRERVDRID